MRIQTPTSTLLALLSPAEALLGSLNPLLNNVLLEPLMGELRVSGTNGDIYYLGTAGAKARGEPITLPTVRLRSIIASAPGTHILLSSTNGHTANIVSGTLADGKFVPGDLRAEIEGLPATGFPPPPDLFGPVAFSVHQADLRDAISRVQHAMATVPEKPSMNGILMALSPGKLVLVAADGIHLAAMEIGVVMQGEDKVSRTIPRAAVPILLKMLGEDGMVNVALADNGAVFEAGGVRLITKLVEQAFPRWEMFLRPVLHQITVPRAALLESISRMRLLSEKQLEWGIRARVKGTRMELHAESAGGFLDDAVVLNEPAPTFNFRVNPRYLASAVRSARSDAVVLEWGDPDNVMLVRGTDAFVGAMVLMFRKPGEEEELEEEGTGAEAAAAEQPTEEAPPAWTERELPVADSAVEPAGLVSLPELRVPPGEYHLTVNPEGAALTKGAAND